MASDKSSTIEKLRARIALVEQGSTRHGDPQETGADENRLGDVPRNASSSTLSEPAARPCDSAFDALSCARTDLPLSDASASPAMASAPDEGDEEGKAFRKILRVAAVREQCTSKLSERLLRDGFAPDAVERAIDHAVRIGAVDDARYAEAYARSRIAAGYGKAGIVRDLEGWGIDSASTDDVRELLADDESLETERALSLLERKPPRCKNKREGAFRKLVQKGYGVSVASDAARRWAQRCG